MSKLGLTIVALVGLQFLAQTACRFDKSGLDADYYITSPPPPDGCVGIPYDFTFVARYAVIEPNTTWAVLGSLPPGLTLETETGRLFGTPSQNGDYTFEIEAIFPNGSNYIEEYTIRIRDLTIIDARKLPPFCPGESYYHQFHACGAMSKSLAWTLADRGNLPAALVLSGDGVLSGTTSATDKGPFTFTVQVTYTTSQENDQKEFELHRGLVVTPYHLPDAATDLPYNHNYAVCGGLAPLTLTIVSGSLPQGIAPIPNSMVIAGTPCRTEKSIFEVQVTDGAMQIHSGAVHALDVVPSALQIVAPAANLLPPAIECQAGYSFHFRANGGSGSCAGLYQWIGSNLQPLGAALDAATGFMYLTIAPSMSTGPYAFGVTVTDTGDNQQVSRDVELIVEEDLFVDPELHFVQVRQNDVNQFRLSPGSGPLRVDFTFDQQTAPDLFNAVQGWNNANPISDLITQARLRFVGTCTRIPPSSYTEVADRNGDGVLDVTAQFDQSLVELDLDNANLEAGDSATARLEIMAVFEQRTYQFTSRLQGISIIE
jgi:hypothetical protein